jgi:hypothetical protein
VRSRDRCDLATHSLAVISLWADHDVHIWRDSNKTVWYSTLQGQAAISVIDVKDIESCVAMVPHELRGQKGSFLVEKPGLCVMGYGENAEPEENREDEVPLD